MSRRRVHYTAKHGATFILGIALLGALSPNMLHAQEIELRWRFEPGTERVYRLVQATQSSTGMGEMSQTQTSTLRQQVLAVAEDGAADVRVTYETIRMVQDGPMGHQEFDSDSGETPTDPMAMIMSHLVGVSFEMTVAPDGEVRRVAGMDKMIDAMAAGVSSENPQAAATMRPMFESMFTDETMRSMMQQGMQTLPDGPVAPGASWPHNTSLEFPFGTLRSETQYTLEEVVTEQGRRIARIGVSGTSGSLEPNPNSRMGGAVPAMQGGEMTGTMDFDVDRGLVRSSTIETNMDMSMGGQAIRTESTVEMTLVEG